jgi:lipopolysaccharide transport system ATP-binding protein
VKKLAPRVPDEKNGKETFIRDVTLGGDCIDGTIDSNGRFEITMKARIEPAMRGKAHFGIRIRRNDGVWCYGVTTELDGEKLRHIEEDLYGVKLVVDPLPLLAGEYGVDVYLLDATGVYRFDGAPGAVLFRVRQHTKEVGLAHLPHHWENP